MAARLREEVEEVESEASQVSQGEALPQAAQAVYVALWHTRCVSLDWQWADLLASQVSRCLAWVAPSGPCQDCHEALRC